MKCFMKLFKPTLFLIILFGANLSFSKTIFYFPEVKNSKDVGLKEDSNLQWVIISGKTTSGARIYINKKKIPYINEENKLKFIRRQKAMIKKGRVIANKDGYFQLHLMLPRGGVQLPLTVRKKKKRKKFQLNLIVKKQEVDIKDSDLLSESPELRDKYSIWLGLGANYLQFKENSLDQSIDLSFDSFKAPAFLLQGRIWLSDIWELEGAYKVSPGAVSSSSGITITSNAYNWTILGGHATYFRENWRPNFWGKMRSRFGVVFGLQQHTVPFISQIASASGKLTTNSVTMLAAGGRALLQYGRQWSYEVFMRVQYPLSTGSVFTIASPFAFDGSVGFSYKLKSLPIETGLFWYGQYQKYSYTHLNAFKAGEVSGDESLFFSVIELRAGYSF